MLDRMNCENYSVHYKHIIDWDHSEDWTDEEVAESPARRWCHKASLLCDYLHSHNGLAEYEPELSRERPDKHEDYDTVLLNCVKVCIRAACDVAAAPSAGVVGYTVGDLRQMWSPRPIPKWVESWFAEPLAAAGNDEAIWL
jgi:hypothetical protein